MPPTAPQPIYTITFHGHDGDRTCHLYTPDDLDMFWRLATINPPHTWTIEPHSMLNATPASRPWRTEAPPA